MDSRLHLPLSPSLQPPHTHSNLMEDVQHDKTSIQTSNEMKWNEMKWNEKMMKWKDDESFWKYQYNLTNDWSPDLHVGDKRPACRSNSLRMPSIKWPATAASDASGPALWSLPLSLSLSSSSFHDLSEMHNIINWTNWTYLQVAGFAENLRGVNCSWHCIVVQSQDPMSWSDPLRWKTPDGRA